MRLILTIAFSTLLLVSPAFAETPEPSKKSDDGPITNKGACIETAKEQYTSTFEQFSAPITGDTVFATSEIFSGFAAFTDKQESNFSLNPIKAIRDIKALGIKVTTAIPVTTTTKSEYADAALQLRDGALFNLTFSATGSPYWPVWYSKDQNSLLSCIEELKNKNLNKIVADKVDKYHSNWRRRFTPDKLYLHLIQYVDDPYMRGYFTHGLSLKALKEGLEDDENDSGSDIAGAATLYFGFGVDGPIEGISHLATEPTTAGTIDFNIGLQHTEISKSALRRIYEDESIDTSGVSSFFASINLQVSNSIFIDIEYVSPSGDADDFMNDVITFSVGYNADKK